MLGWLEVWSPCQAEFPLNARKVSMPMKEFAHSVITPYSHDRSTPQPPITTLHCHFASPLNLRFLASYYYPIYQSFLMTNFLNPHLCIDYELS